MLGIFVIIAKQKIMMMYNFLQKIEYYAKMNVFCQYINNIIDMSSILETGELPRRDQDPAAYR